MMEEFSDNELEKRLREAARDFRLGPSEKVWKGVRHELHPSRRRYPYFLAAILLLVAAGVYIGKSRKTAFAGTAQTFVQGKPVPATGKGVSGSLAGEAPLPAKASTVVSAPAFPVMKASAPVRGSRSNRLAAGGERSMPAIPGVHAWQGQGQGQRQGFPLLQRKEADFQPLAGAGLETVSCLPVPHTASDDLQKQAGPASGMASKGRKRKQLRRKGAFGVFFTPAAGYRTLKGGSAPPATPADYPRLSLLARPPIGPVKQREEPDFGWNAGAEVMLPLGGPWLLRSGLSVSRTGYRIRAYGTYPAYVGNNGTVSYATGNQRGNSYYAIDPAGTVSPRPSWVHVRYLTAGIPLMLAAEFGPPGKVSWTLATGAVAGWVLSSNPVIYSPDSKRYFTDTHLVRPFRTSLDLEALINLPLHGALQISTGPSFEYQLFSSYRNYPQVKEHPYLLGISAGLQWRK